MAKKLLATLYRIIFVASSYRFIDYYYIVQNRLHFVAMLLVLEKQMLAVGVDLSCGMRTNADRKMPVVFKASNIDGV